MNPGSNELCLCSNRISKSRLVDLPRFDNISVLKNIPNFSDLDLDINLPSQVNCNSFTTHDFHNNTEITNCSNNSLSTIHCNRSLNANFYHLNLMLIELQHNFDIIVLSEIKFRSSSEPNFSLSGYDFIYQPSLPSAGGVAFYSKENLKFNVRSYLNSLNENYESLWR